MNRPTRLAVGAIFAAALFFAWNACIPDALWHIYIPIYTTASAFPLQTHPELASMSFATGYAEIISGKLSATGSNAGRDWKIVGVSSPAAGISISLAAPFDAAITERFEQFPVQLPAMLEPVRQQRFSAIGLELASEAEFLENALASSAIPPRRTSSPQQTAHTDDLQKDLDLRWQKQRSLMEGLEKELSPHTAGAAVSKRRNPGPINRYARHRKKTAKSGKLRKAKPGTSRADLRQTRLEQRLAQARIEFERLDRERTGLAEKKHALEIALQRRQSYETRLGMIEKENSLLAALFESGHGKPDFSRKERTLPSALLRAVVLARPLALVIGPLLVWFLFRKDEKTPRSMFPGTEIPILGYIPPLQPEALESMLHPSSFASAAPREALLIRKIAMDLFLSAKAGECSRLAFFGTHGGCGTSACVALVTAALANDAKHILLLDLHWARPAQHRLWWIPWATGTTNWLASGSIPAAISADPGSGSAHARVIAAGPLPPSPEDALTGAPWPLWFSSFPANSPDSLLLVDAGNASESIETGRRLASSLDGVILVANSGSPDQLKNALAEFEAAARPVVGIIFNDGALKRS